jgi:hypothetical protein
LSAGHSAEFWKVVTWKNQAFVGEKLSLCKLVGHDNVEVGDQILRVAYRQINKVVINI